MREAFMKVHKRNYRAPDTSRCGFVFSNFVQHRQESSCIEINT